MTDSSEFKDPTNGQAAGEQPEEPELRGRYVKGDYGDAGMQTGPRADEEEGKYSQGNFGEAGAEGGIPGSLSSRAREAGRFVMGDYDEAGVAGGSTAQSEIGRYTEGNYGSEGVVGPAREAAMDAVLPDAAPNESESTDTEETNWPE